MESIFCGIVKFGEQNYYSCNINMKLIMAKALGRKAISRERIVTAASQAIRSRGFDGVGVINVMKEAGLTHGGFYFHFKSRDELLAVALKRASSDLAQTLMVEVDRLGAKGVSPFRAFLEVYLSEYQIEDTQFGCPVGGLCSEMPRQGRAVLDASKHVVNALHRTVQKFMGARATVGVAWSVTSTLVGAIQLARALGNNKQGKAVLAAARADLLERFDNYP